MHKSLKRRVCLSTRSHPGQAAAKEKRIKEKEKQALIKKILEKVEAGGEEVFSRELEIKDGRLVA